MDNIFKTNAIIVDKESSSIKSSYLAKLAILTVKLAPEVINLIIVQVVIANSIYKMGIVNNAKTATILMENSVNSVTQVVKAALVVNQTTARVVSLPNQQHCIMDNAKSVNKTNFLARNSANNAWKTAKSALIDKAVRIVNKVINIINKQSNAKFY